MGAVLKLAFGWVLNRVFATSLITFVIKFILFTVFTILGTQLVSLIPGWLDFGNALSGVPSGVYWCMSYFRFDFGIPLVAAAYVQRFILRRIPGIG